MSCINPNSPEFKKILEIEPNFLLAEIMYDEMMKQQDQSYKLYDEIINEKQVTPIKQAKEILGRTENWGYKKPKSIAKISDKQLRTLMSDPRYNKISDPEMQVKFNEVATAIGEKEAWRDYFETKGIVRPSADIMQKLLDRVAEEDAEIDRTKINPADSYDKPMPSIDEFINDFEAAVDAENRTQAISVAERMSKQLNIPYEIISQEEMAERFPDQPYRKQFYQGGKVYLVAGNISASDVFHEFSHPIIKSMSKQNPELFQQLFNELSQTELGKQILNDLNSDPSLTPGTSAYMEEAITMALEAINQNEELAPQGFIKNLFFQIKQFLRKVFGKKIDVSRLNSKTTLADLVKMINYGEEFILDTNFLEKDMLAMFKTDYEQLKQQIETRSLEKTQQFMNKWNDVVKAQLAAFKAENDVYFQIQEGLADENREGLLNKAQKILERLATLNTISLNEPLQTLNITGLDADVITFNNKIRSFATAINTVEEVFDLLDKKLNKLNTSGVKTDNEFDQLFAIMKYTEDWLRKINQWQDEYITGAAAVFGGTFRIQDENGNFIDANPLSTTLTELATKLKTTKALGEKLQMDSVIDVLYDHLKDQMEPIKKDFEEQMAAAKANGMISQYNRLHEQYYGLTPQELVEFNRLKTRPINTLSREEMINLQNLQLRSFDSEVISKEGLRATMEGRLGSAHKWSSLIESHMNNQDKVVGGFQSFLMKTFNTVNGNANARRGEMLNGLQPLLEAAGYDTHLLGEGKLGKDIGQKSTSFKMDNNGNVKEFLEWRFLNNFYNYEYDQQVIQEKIKFARQKYNMTPSQANKDEWTAAKEELEEFNNKYMHRDNVAEFYNVAKKWFNTPSGKLAKAALDDIFDRIRIIAENAEVDPLKGGFNEATDELWHEYQLLHNPFDFATGKEKTGIEKEIADILSGYREEISEFYEWEEKENSFELALETLHEKLVADGLNPGDAGYVSAFQDFLEKNTTIAVKEEYHEYREALIEERTELIQPIQDINNSFIDVGPMYKQIFAILKPTKDNFNQYNGGMLTPAAQQEIRDIQQTIANLKEQWLSIAGYTREELRNFRRIQQFYEDNGSFEYDDDSDYYFNFWDDVADRLASFGILKEDVERVREIDKELSSQKVSGLTSYYINTLFSFYTTNDESKDLFDEAFKAYDLSDPDDVPSSKTIFEVIKNKDFSDKLKAVNPGFKAWFERNHYEEAVDEFDPVNGSFIGEYTRNKPTSAWQFSFPSGAANYETKSVIGSRIPPEFMPNGYVEINGIPRIPTRAYYRRKVKDEFKTEIIERDYIDASGNLVLANVDNKGNWLPRDYNAGDPSSATDDKYVDANYKAMFNNNRPLWDLLDKLKNNHLDNQRALDAPQKLYLSYPRFRMGEVEQYQKGYATRKYNRIKETFQGAEDDYELGLNDSRFQRDSYKTLTRPISGTYTLDINDVSTNIIDKMMDYAYSVEEFKTLRKVNSFAQSFEEVLINAYSNATPTMIEKMVKDYELLNPGGREEALKDRRIQAIKGVVDKYFRGKNLTGLVTGVEDPSDTTKTIARIISKAQSQMSFMTFAFDFMKDLRNYYGGKSMMYKKAAEGWAYNAKDVAITRAKSASIIGEIIANQYSNKQVSARLQLLDILDAIPGGLKKEIGRRGSKTLQQSIIGGDILYATRKYTSESVPVHQFLAILEHNSFMLNGKKTSLDEAVEVVDGKIQTVAGVPAEMSISYDADGRIKFGNKLQEIINTHQGFLQKSLGINNQYNEAEMYRSLMGKAQMYMLKFMPGMFFDRYQIRTKKNKITGASKAGMRRINYNTKRAEVGTYLSIIVLGQEVMSNYKKFWKWNNYSWQAKKGLMQLMLAYTISMLIKLITGSIGFDDDDDELTNFYWDPEAEEIYAKLRKSTSLPELPLIADERTIKGTNRRFNPENYLKLQTLRLFLLVKKEEETFMPTNILSSAQDIVTLQSPLSDGGALKGIKDMSTALYSTFWGSDDAYYEKAAGPYRFQQKDSNKFWSAFSKTFFGLSGSLIDPATSIQRENSDFFK